MVEPGEFPARAGKPTPPPGRATNVPSHAGQSAQTWAPPVTPGATWAADAALEDLYAAHWHSLVRLAVLLVRDLGVAEDVVQDSFVAMHGRWRRLRDPNLALAYLRQSVVNKTRSVLRHRNVVDRHASTQGHWLLADPGTDPTGASTRRTAILEALQQLPRRQREVLALRYYADLSEAEIAAGLGISRGAVKSHASRGVAALRSLLADEPEESP